MDQVGGKGTVSEKELGLSHSAAICFLILLCSTCHLFLCHTPRCSVWWHYSHLYLFSLLKI